VNVAPKKALEGRGTAIAPELGMVVMSIGKDDGVLEGDVFTVYRGGEFVAKVAVDRADRKWCAGKVTLKKSDPKVGDDASNHIFQSAPTPRQSAPSERSLTGKVTATAIEIALVVVSLGSDQGVSAGDEFTVSRNAEDVARIVIDRVDTKWSAGRIVEKIIDPKVADDVILRKTAPKMTISTQERLDLQSAASLESIRLKMGLKE